MILLPCDQKLHENQLHDVRELKEDNEKTKTKRWQYGVREGSPVEVQWVVQWVGEDLWWEGFVEQVCFKFGTKERGSDGWCDGGDGRRMMNEVDGMKQEDYSKDWMMHAGMT